MTLVFCDLIILHTPVQGEATSARGSGPNPVQGVEATSERGNYWFLFNTSTEFAPRICPTSTLVLSIVSFREIRMRMLSKAAYSLVSLHRDIVGFVLMDTLH